MATPNPPNLARALLALQAEGKSGVLEVRADEIRTLIYLSEGKPAFAEEGTLDETLGRLLLRQRKLTYEQYKRAIDCMTQAMAKGALLRFGEAVEVLGFMTAADVADALAEQMRFKVVRCLQWEKAEWDFDPSPQRLNEVGKFPSRVEPMLLEAAKLFPPKRRKDVLSAAEGRFPKVIGSTDDVAQRYELGLADTERLDSLNGGTEFDGARLAGDLGALLAALMIAGDVELLNAASGPRKPSRAPPPPISLRAAVPRNARPRKPAAGAPPSVDARREAAKMVGRLRFSRSVAVKVTSPPALAPDNPHQARLLAEQAFQAGRGLLRANLLDRAVPLLRRAAELYPDALEYRLYAEWVAHRLPENAGKPMPAALKLLAEKAVKRDPNFAFGHYVLGHIARVEGDTSAADALFAHASKLEPELADRERHVRIVSRPPPPMQGSAARAKPGVPPPLPKRALKPALKPVSPVAPSPAPTPTPTPTPKPDAVAIAESAPAEAPRSDGKWTTLTIALLVASLAIGIVVWWPASAAPRLPAPPAPPRPTATPSAQAAAPTVPATIASAAPTAPAASTAPVTSAAPSTMGDITTPPSAAGHRVFLDGRVLGEAPGTFHVPCGLHTSKIGSAGKSQTIDVPCGGEVTLPE